MEIGFSTAIQIYFFKYYFFFFSFLNPKFLLSVLFSSNEGKRVYYMTAVRADKQVAERLRL